MSEAVPATLPLVTASFSLGLAVGRVKLYDKVEVCYGLVILSQVRLSVDPPKVRLGVGRILLYKTRLLLNDLEIFLGTQSVIVAEIHTSLRTLANSLLEGATGASAKALYFAIQLCFEGGQD